MNQSSSVVSNLKHKQITQDKQYKELLDEIKIRLRQSKMNAAIKVNSELLLFYWSIGNIILAAQKNTKWGDKLFDLLAKDLAISFPNTQGFSKTNLKYMRTFAIHYSNGDLFSILPEQLTWTHHVVLIQFLNADEVEKKQWYAVQAVEQGWSYREMKSQIASDLYARQSKKAIKTTNFQERLPPHNSLLAQEMIKEPYKFHFLTIGEDAYEKDIHKGLVEHVQQFLMELGQGFALYGSNYPIYVSNKRFEIDLLMYNTKLHSYFVLEIKRGEFKPEHAGQLNFYLSAIDEQLKMPEDGPTIGLLLCENKDKVIAEYALRRVDSPMGISEYQLSRALPAQLNNILPSTEEIEAELSKDFAEEDPMDVEE